jgi:hypothetical protein
MIIRPGRPPVFRSENDYGHGRKDRTRNYSGSGPTKPEPKSNVKNDYITVQDVPTPYSATHPRHFASDNLLARQTRVIDGPAI